MTPLPPDPESISNTQLYLMLQDMRGSLSNVSDKLSSLEKEQRDMLDTWKAGKTVLRIIKLAGSIGLAVGAIIAAIKGVGQ